MSSVQHYWALVLGLIIGGWVGMCIQAYLNSANNLKLTELKHRINQLEALGAYKSRPIYLIARYLRSSLTGNGIQHNETYKAVIENLCNDIAKHNKS